MAVLMLRNFSDTTFRALKFRAEQHGHSLEQEVCRILEDVTRRDEALGTSLARIGKKWRQMGGRKLNAQTYVSSIEPAQFE